MAEEPTTRNAIAFIDGQNLFRHAKSAFGHHHPNYDPKKLFTWVCQQKHWHAKQIRFYTGIPREERDQRWHGYWRNRIRSLKEDGIVVETRKLAYHLETAKDSGGNRQEVLIAKEKGVDVRLALDK